MPKIYTEYGNSPDLYVEPLLYDCLSGEFAYVNDTEQRKHTMGRLAYASYDKGIHIKSEDFDEDVVLATYTPSWAPRAEAAVSYRTSRGVALVNSVYVQRKGTSDGPLFTMDRERKLVIADKEDVYYSVELGSKLHVARQAVTEVM